MKKILLIAAFMLSGCSTISNTYNNVMDAWFIKYDPNEYMFITELKTHAEMSADKCNKFETGEELSDQLAMKSALFYNYAKYQPHNTVILRAAKELDDIVIGLRNQYKNEVQVGPAFCKAKLKNIVQGAESIQRAVGAKPR